jgi:HlyD family secretion protein
MGAGSKRTGAIVTRRRLAIALAVVGAGALVALALRPSPVAVELATVTRGPMQVTIDQEGETRVRDRYIVSAPLAGQVLRIELEPGDPVAANRTVLATFRPMAPGLLNARTRAELQARLAAAEATLNATRAQQDRTVAELAQAQRELQRSRQLAASGAIAAEQLEAAELAAKTLANAADAARAGVRAAEADVRMARASLMPGRGADAAAIVLRAPVNGLVLRRLRESEAVVPQGEPLLEIGDTAKLEVVADFLSTDAVQIRPGQAARIERWGGGESIPGRVRRVEPSGFTKVSALGVEEQRVNVIVDVEQARDALLALGDRYRVEVRVVVWEVADTLKVPIGSLVRDGDRWFVYLVRDGRAARTPIQIGQRNETEAQLLTPLAQGTSIVAYPGSIVDDGVAVEAR